MEKMKHNWMVWTPLFQNTVMFGKCGIGIKTTNKFTLFAVNDIVMKTDEIMNIYKKKETLQLGGIDLCAAKIMLILHLTY